MTSRKYKVGLLGAGYIAEWHGKAISPLDNVEVVAVCDINQQSVQQLSNQLNCASFSDVDDLLTTDLDAVHILLPPDLHVPMAYKVLDAGCHVFLEKPMGIDPVECAKLVSYAEEKGLKVSVNHNFLFLPAYEKLRADIKQGVIGQLERIDINWLFPLAMIKSGPFGLWMLREPQNLMYELGPHLVAFLVDLVGDVDDIQVRPSHKVLIPGSTHVFQKWRINATKGNTEISLNLSLVPGYPDRSISVRGTAAVASCDYERDIYSKEEFSSFGMLFDNAVTPLNTGRQIVQNAGGNFISAFASTLTKKPGSTPFGVSMQRSVQAFYKMLDSGVKEPRLEGALGSKIIELCDRMIEKASVKNPNEKKSTFEFKSAKKPTVLVFGGTGFIGKHLVRQLIDKGHGVRVFSRGQRSAQSALWGIPVDIFAGSLSSTTDVDKALEGIDTVYHLARAEGDTWQEYYEQDVLVTKNIAERCLKKGVKRFFYTGTIDSYYSALAENTITELTPLDPDIETRNLYARSKANCEQLLTRMCERDGLPLTIFRPGVVIGEGCSPFHWGVGMWHSETRMQFWGEGNTKLPLVLVEDVAEALVNALDASDIKGKSFNLIADPCLTGQEYIEACSQLSGTKIRAQTGSIRLFYLDDLVKNIIKYAIKHPKRKMPSYNDWDSRAHRAYYDCHATKEALSWNPVSDKEKIIEEGIAKPLSEA